MICDDLGSGDLGFMGSQIPTPNLDKLAAEGRHFTHFNAGHPICSASRAALLTGRYATRSHTLGAFFPNEPRGMNLDETTIADLFRRKGYNTQAIGKWHLGDASEYLPTKRGFDHFLGVPYSVDMQPLPLIRDTQVLEADTDRDQLTPMYTKEAVRFIEQTAKPFFLYVAFSYPHDPAKASTGFHGSTQFGEYGDSVHEIDWSVGEIVAALRQKGILEDTLILFTSDHGPWFQGNPGNLRGRKGSTFEGGFRVPLIAHWPRGLTAGTKSEEWMSNLDILPTLASICQLDLPAKPLDGVNADHNLLGDQERSNRPAVLYFAPLASNGLEVHCARKGQWKLRIAQVSGEIYINDAAMGHVGSWLPYPELYDLNSDSTESYDIARLHPEIVQSILHDIRSQVSTFPDEVTTAFSKLQANVASATTPPGAAPRPKDDRPLPTWAWEPPDRREQKN